MAAYAIFVRNKLNDAEEIAAYSALARASMNGHDMERIVSYGDLEVVEGDPAEGVVIFKFADMAAVRAWYYSPEYQASIKHRLNGANYRVLFADGVA